MRLSPGRAAGLAFLTAAVTLLLQKFGLFLGHPNYALSVVLAALLFATATSQPA